MAPPPVAAKKGKSPIFWFVAGCCGCLVAGLVVVGLIFGLGIGGAVFGTQGAVDAAKTQIAAIHKGDFDKAYGLCSRSMQSEISREDFQTSMASHPGLVNNSDTTFMSRSVNNDRAHLVGLLSASSGEKEPVAFDLVKERGNWKVSGIHLGSEAGSTP
jgi:hypothetical protein